MAQLTFETMHSMQEQLLDRYKDKWPALSPAIARDKLLWMMIEAGEMADIIKKKGGDIMENKMEKYARQQLLFTKILCCIFALVLVCILVLTVAVSGAAKQLVEIIAPLENAVGQVEDVAVQVNDMTDQAEIIMDNMQTVTQTLADADLGSMVENVNTLTVESQSVVAEAMEKLDAIDINTLNKAIQDLADVVEPLAKVSKIFG